MLTAGPTGTLATVGTEYLYSVLSAMVFGTDGAGVTDSVASGVVEGDRHEVKSSLGMTPDSW
jgi:hypothetical protein